MNPVPTASHQGSGRYAIRIQGHLEPRWAGWFDGLRLTHDCDGTTVIDGPVADQAALHGLLRKVRDVGLPLISVTRIDALPPERDTVSRADQEVRRWAGPSEPAAPRPPRPPCAGQG